MFSQLNSTRSTGWLPLILGLLLGAGVGAWARRPVPQRCPDRAALEDQVAALEQALVDNGRGKQVALSQAAMDGQDPLPLPTPVPALLSTREVRDALRATKASRVYEVDCSELPCVAALWFAGQHKPMVRSQAASRKLESQGYVVAPKGQVLMITSPPGFIFALALHDTTPSYVQLQRARVRLQRLKNTSFFAIRAHESR